GHPPRSAVRGVVRLLDVRRDATPVADGVAVLVRPGANRREVGAARARTARTAGSGGRATAHAAARTDVGLECRAQLLRIRRRQVDLVIASVEGEPNGLAVVVDDGAVEIVDQLGDLPFHHSLDYRASIRAPADIPD